MNGVILIELRIDATALTPDERTLLGVFMELPSERLLHCLRVLYHWEQAGTPRKAIALKLLNAELSSKDVARLCGLSDRQLRRYREYQTFARLLRAQQNPPHRGAKGKDGEE